MRLVILLIGLLLSGCATVMDSAKSQDTFATCKAVDVATTVIGVSSGAFPEGNPLVAKLLSQGYMPFVLLSVAMWYIVDRVNHPSLTMGVNVVTCPVAVRNVLLLVQ